MASSLLQFNYSLVDNIIVGRYVSEKALAAVGCVGPINSFIIGAALGLTTGFTIPVAHAFGEGNRKKLCHFAGNSIFIAFAPFDNPEIAISVVLEHGASGYAAGTVVKNILDSYFFTDSGSKGESMPFTVLQ